MATDLLTETLELLRNDTRTINDIADGAGVNRHWLAKLKQGKFDNPGVRTIEQLHAFLLSTQEAAPPPKSQLRRAL